MLLTKHTSKTKSYKYKKLKEKKIDTRYLITKRELVWSLEIDTRVYGNSIQ